MQLVKVAPPFERECRIGVHETDALSQIASQDIRGKEVFKDKIKAGRRSGADYRLVRRRIY